MAGPAAARPRPEAPPIPPRRPPVALTPDERNLSFRHALCPPPEPHAQLSRFRKARRRTRGQGRGTARAWRRAATPSRSPRRSRGSRPRRRRRCEDLYAQLTPWQKTQVARHPQRPHCLDYVDGADHGFHAAGRRPQVRRGRGDRRRLRPLPRRRPSASSARRRAPTPRAASGTISAWRRPEGYRKAVRLMELADRFDLPVISLRRHRRRLSRHRRRGARPGRGHRPLDRCLPRARRAQRRGGHRRGRLGRRHRHRHRQPRADAGARDLHRDLAGGRGLDPVARHRPGRRTPPPT